MHSKYPSCILEKPDHLRVFRTQCIQTLLDCIAEFVGKFLYRKQCDLSPHLFLAISDFKLANISRNMLQFRQFPLVNIPAGVSTPILLPSKFYRGKFGSGESTF